jgi:hypothetical protein
MITNPQPGFWPNRLLNRMSIHGEDVEMHSSFYFAALFRGRRQAGNLNLSLISQLFSNGPKDAFNAFS